MIRENGTGVSGEKRRRSAPVDIDSIITITPGAIAVDSEDLNIPAITRILIDKTPAGSSHLTMGIHFINSMWDYGNNGKLGFIKVSTIIRLLRIIGLMAVLSYMIVILFTWIYANHQGYVYFSAGEPVSLIKYFEWVLGSIGIISTASVLRRELDS